MSKEAFTAGPWEYDNRGGSLWMEDGICFSANLGDIGNGAHIEWLSIIASNGGEIAQVSGPADDSIIDADSDDYLKWPATDEQAIANAHLIASTPELYAVLEWYAENARLARLIHSEGDKGRQALADDGGKKAFDILKKARGEVETNLNKVRGEA